MKILVTDGNNRASLAITRSLGREGHEVIVGAERLSCLASCSKYCKKSFTYSDPEKYSESFLLEVLQLVKDEKIEVLMPVSEITTLLLMLKKGAFEKYCSIPFHSYDSVNKAASKAQVIRIAQNIGIPIPLTHFLENPDEINSAIIFSSTVGFPVVVKPSRSRILNIDGWRATGVKYANNKNELIDIINNFSNDEYPLLIQERIYGHGVGLFTCFNHGEMIAVFSHRRHREKPPSGGVSVLRESIAFNKIIKNQSEKLLKELNWHGVAMVEFKQDNRTKDFKLMEINGRFWGSLQLAIDAGVNFPSILVKIAAGEDIVPVMSYKTGTKTRWLWGDIDALLARLLKRDKSLNLPKDYPGRLKCALDFIKFWGKDLRYEILDQDDIRPWLFETRRWLLGK